MIDFLKQLTDPQSIIEYGGLALLLFVVFAETGLLVGFFLPGDSLIFIAGMLCKTKMVQLNVNLMQLIIALSAAAILGNIAGYWFGRKVGSALFSRADSLLFKKKHLELTKTFYEKRGALTLVMGRFLPIIRTFAPILAGVIKADFTIFMWYNLMGALAWIGSLASMGYYLGGYVWVQQNIGWIVIALIVITAVPLLIGLVRKKWIGNR
jgi:membrane-associated protein